MCCGVDGLGLFFQRDYGGVVEVVVEWGLVVIFSGGCWVY